MYFAIVGRIGLCIYGVHYAAKRKVSSKAFLGVILAVCLSFEIIILSQISAWVYTCTDRILKRIGEIFDRYF